MYVTVSKHARLLYCGEDRDKAMRRHKANVGSRLYKDHVLLSTRVTTAKAERLLRIEQGHEEPTQFVKKLPSHMHRQPKK